LNLCESGIGSEFSAANEEKRLLGMLGDALYSDSVNFYVIGVSKNDAYQQSMFSLNPEARVVAE
jgi:hypothetical protein